METVKKVFSTLINILNLVAPTFKKPTSTTGIKETSEMFVGVNELALLLCQRFSDGVGIDDFTAIWDKLQKDPEFKAKMEAAYDKFQQIPAEFKDLDVGEGLELGALQLEYVPKYIDAFKKDEAPTA